MKILIDGRLYGLENAGLGRYVMNLVAELSKLDTKNEYVLLLRKKYYDSLNLPNNWKKVPADFRHYSFAEQFILPGIIKKEKADIIHFPHFNFPIFFKGKFIVTIHDMLMHKSVGLSATTLSAPLYLLKRLGYRLVFDSAVKRAKAVIVPSKSVKDELLAYYKISSQKVFVTHEGVDIKNPSSGRNNIINPYFIYTGNAYPHKNLERLIEATVILNRNSTRKINLLIASSRGIFTQRLENIIMKTKATQYVKLLGFVPDEKLANLYKNSEGFVFPSLSEGFGLPGLEAMSAGTMVLVSDIPVFKEIYKDNSIYFNPLDASSIEKTMESVLKMKPVLRNKRIESAKNFVKHYSWSKMAKETLVLYESCNSLQQS